MTEIIVKGVREFVRFYSSLDSSSDQYREIDRVLDLLKGNPCLGTESGAIFGPSSM